MKPVYSEEENDCLRCCLATILELPYSDVPDFYNKYRYAHTQNNAVDEWLKQFGLMTMIFGYNDWCYAFKKYKPIYLLSGVTKFRVNKKPLLRHTVIMQGTKIIHDPEEKVKSVEEFSVNHPIDAHLIVPLNPTLKPDMSP